MAKRGRAIAGGAALLVGAGAAFFYLREKNSETPDYEPLAVDGRFSVRLYSPYLVAETVQRGSREAALAKGFRLLADYIFAKSRGSIAIADGGRRIAMTAPVTAEPAGSGEWRISFVMPARYSRATLPPPGPEVSIAERSERTVAALRFSGVATPERLADQEAMLREWLEMEGHRAAGPPEYAFYNSPLIPGPLRRNEVMIPIA